VGESCKLLLWATNTVILYVLVVHLKTAAEGGFILVKGAGVVSIATAGEMKVLLLASYHSLLVA